MDKKIPPLPPRRPIPQKPNIIKNANSSGENKVEANHQTKIANNQSKSISSIKEDAIKNQQENENIKLQDIAQEGNLNSENLETTEKENQNNQSVTNKEDLGQEQLQNIKSKNKNRENFSQNIKYKTLFLSILCAMCFVGAIISFVFVLL